MSFSHEACIKQFACSFILYLVFFVIKILILFGLLCFMLFVYILR